ncbi:hypothetical protein SO802_002768 [Lithocarpus litseifolius]|uniref:Uncharacterized protein n=1 Tax=Lithocarpus litseifolius TaxID=425828 RepID=A0AAW2E1X7_9ROSI
MPARRKTQKGLQLWLNLSSKDKMSEFFFMLKGFLKVEVLKSMILSKVHSLGLTEGNGQINSRGKTTIL